MPSQATPTQDSSAGIEPLAPWRVKALSVLPDYRLAVTFQDGSSGTVDLSGVTTAEQAGIFAELADLQVFQQASLEVGVVTWPNGADLDPAWMYEMLGDGKTWSVPF